MNLVRLLIITQMASLKPIDETITVWQLYSRCSSAFVQIFLKHANARGQQFDHCLTDFVIQADNEGRIRMENAFTGKFICFNKRQRLAVRSDGMDAKCLFREQLTSSGYTMFQSAWRQNLFLGFNRKGKFQDPSQINTKRRCFLFTKLLREVRSTRLKSCSNSEKDDRTKLNLEAQRQHYLYNVIRESLLSRIRATMPLLS
ncbi:Fibroblast growth factor [Dirofilaria immitis]